MDTHKKSLLCLPLPLQIRVPDCLHDISCPLCMIQRRGSGIGGEFTWNNHNLPDKMFLCLDLSYNK